MVPTGLRTWWKLDFLLPSANDSKESVVVLLDWYAGHLTEEVAALVRAKGHVLVFHGGGCTPFTQVNDTHLHATLARLLIQIENQWALDERTRLVNMGKNKTPKMSREEILSIVQTAWLLIDHEKVAQKGYKQTGPGMPLTGPVAPEDVFADLLKVLEQIDPSPTPLAVGTALRDEAVAFVKAEYDAGRLTSWDDCHKLIEDQDGVGEAVVEGMEAYSYEAEDSQGEGDGDTDGEDDDDLPPVPPPGGSPGGPPDADDGLADDNEHGDSDIGGDDGDDGPGGGAGGVVIIDGAEAADSSKADGESAEAAESKRALQVAAARQIIYEEAVRTKNDLMMKHMRAAMRGETKKQRDCGTNVSMLLRTRAKEFSDAEAKLRRESIEEERLSAKDVEETKKITAQAKQAEYEARLACLQQIIVNRRDNQAKKHGEVVEKAFQKWLQTEYPAILGRDCIETFRALSKEARAGFQRHIEKLRKGRTFERQLFIQDLWEDDRTFTNEWKRTTPFLGGARRAVRCGLPFEVLVDTYAPKTAFGHDPAETLRQLFQLCVGDVSHIFTASYSPLRLLHVNDYVLEKAFVYGIISLSKWLGKEWWPMGVYGKWPPTMPADLVPRFPGSSVVSVDTTAPSQAASSSSGTVPAGKAASPSTSTVHPPSQAAYSSSAAVHAGTAKSSPYQRLQSSTSKKAP